MKLVTLVSNNVGVDTYLELRKAVNFKPLSRTQAKKALDNSFVYRLRIHLMPRSLEWDDL